jgi:hypothetical protein
VAADGKRLLGLQRLRPRRGSPAGRERSPAASGQNQADLRAVASRTKRSLRRTKSAIGSRCFGNTCDGASRFLAAVVARDPPIWAATGSSSARAVTVQIRVFGYGPRASTGAEAECLRVADPVEEYCKQAPPLEGVAGVIEDDTSQAGGAGLVRGAGRTLRCVARRRRGRAGRLCGWRGRVGLSGRDQVAVALADEVRVAEHGLSPLRSPGRRVPGGHRQRAPSGPARGRDRMTPLRDAGGGVR